jgi:hypothetical protein
MASNKTMGDSNKIACPIIVSVAPRYMGFLVNLKRPSVASIFGGSECAGVPLLCKGKYKVSQKVNTTPKTKGTNPKNLKVPKEKATNSFVNIQRTNGKIPKILPIRIK